jgi:hypothetical protein
MLQSMADAAGIRSNSIDDDGGGAGGRWWFLFGGPPHGESERRSILILRFSISIDQHIDHSHFFLRTPRPWVLGVYWSVARGPVRCYGLEQYPYKLSKKV